MQDVVNAVWAVFHGKSSSKFCFLKRHINYDTCSETAELQSQIHTELAEDLLSYQLEFNPILSSKELLEE